MASKIATAALQYSKWLSRFICWVWAIYRFSVLIAAALQPSVAEPLATTIVGMDTIMMINEGTYLVNSLGEKWIYSDRAVLSFIKHGGLAQIFSKVTSKQEDEEGDENG